MKPQKKNRLFNPFSLVSMVSIVLFIAINSNTQTLQSRKNIPVSGLTKSLPQGKTISCEAILEIGYTPQSAEITPAEGISVTDWKMIEKIGMKQVKWSFNATVDSSAAAGKRQMVIVTRGGRTVPQEVEVVTSIPIISNFKIIRLANNPAEIVFSFQVSDAFADLGDLNKKIMTVNLTPPGKTALQVFCFPDSVTRLGNDAYEVKMALTLTGYSFYSGMLASLEFAIDDTSGNTSAEFKQNISF